MNRPRDRHVIEETTYCPKVRGREKKVGSEKLTQREKSSDAGLENRRMRRIGRAVAPIASATTRARAGGLLAGAAV